MSCHTKGRSVDIRDCLSNAAYSAPFRKRELCARGAWSREACIAVALAARVGITLDEESLIICDVRDLQALQGALQLKAEKRRLSKAAACALQLTTSFGRGSHDKYPAPCGGQGLRPDHPGHR
jgi:hypothetical protein